MNPWIPKAVILAAVIGVIAIRAPHGSRSRRVRVVRSYKGGLEVLLVTLAQIAFLVPVVWAIFPVLSFADYRLRVASFVAGVVCLAVGLWLFYRSHADLSTNWSVTLELRENHRLITHGVYRSIRHPMYSAILLYAVGQTLVVPNWLAGPSYLIAMVLLCALRIGAEERMMFESFGSEYAAYTAKTKRLLPGLW